MCFCTDKDGGFSHSAVFVQDAEKQHTCFVYLKQNRNISLQSISSTINAWAPLCVSFASVSPCLSSCKNEGIVSYSDIEIMASWFMTAQIITTVQRKKSFAKASYHASVTMEVTSVWTISVICGFIKEPVCFIRPACQIVEPFGEWGGGEWRWGPRPATGLNMAVILNLYSVPVWASCETPATVSKSLQYEHTEVFLQVFDSQMRACMLNAVMSLPAKNLWMLVSLCRGLRDTHWGDELFLAVLEMLHGMFSIQVHTLCTVSRRSLKRKVCCGCCKPLKVQANEWVDHAAKWIL